MAYDSEQKVKLLILYDILCRLTDENHALKTDEWIAELAQNFSQGDDHFAGYSISTVGRSRQ